MIPIFPVGPLLFVPGFANLGESRRFENVANRGGSKPWQGTARFMVQFAKKPNYGVAGRFAVCQLTNRTMVVWCGPCKPPWFVEPWSTLALVHIDFIIVRTSSVVETVGDTNVEMVNPMKSDVMAPAWFCQMYFEQQKEIEYLGNVILEHQRQDQNTQHITPDICAAHKLALHL